MNKTNLLSLAAVLATSAVLCESSRAAVHNEPDLGNSLEQRIERMSPQALEMIKRNGVLIDEEIARAWGNGGGRAWGNGGGRRRAWGNGGGGFANGYRGGFANW
jgi:rSAM-associated Gly-rich repeat protein